MKPLRSSEHLKFIRTLPCSVPGCQSNFVDAAHIGPHGMSQKASDLSTAPLCRKHHREYDSNPRAFEARYKLSMVEIAAMLTRRPQMRIETGSFVAYLEDERYICGPVSIGPAKALKLAIEYFKAWRRETLIDQRRRRPQCEHGRAREATA